MRLVSIKPVTPRWVAILAVGAAGLAAQSSMCPCQTAGGPQSVGVFLINLKNSPTPDGGLRDVTLPSSCDPASIERTLFGAEPGGSVHEYYDEVSGGRVSIVGKVIGVVTIDDPEPENRQCFAGPKLVAAVDAAARATGLDFASFSRRVYITAPRMGCRTAASGGPRASGAGVPVSIFGGGCPAASHAAHELGHTFGLGHSMLDTELGGGPWGAASQESGDVMGYSGTLTPFNAVHRDQLGWIRPERRRVIEPAELASGRVIDVYLSPLHTESADNADPQVVIVPLADGRGRNFYLSFRQPKGLDRNLDQEAPSAGIAGGPYRDNLSIHWFEHYCPDVYGDESNTVQHRSFLLATLKDGGEFSPRGAGLTFRQVGVAAARGSLHVQIVASWPPPRARGARR